MFELIVHTDNDAFKNHESSERDELARILREVAESIEAGNEAGGVRDCNGNRCGAWIIKEPGK